jgi:hypothetical protein
MVLRKTGAHLEGTAGRVKEVGIDAAWPEFDTLDSMLAQLLEHDGGRAKVNGRSIVAVAENFPDMLLEESQPVVAQVLGKIGVVGDDQRQTQSASVFSAAVVKGGDPQQGGIGDVEEIGLELSDDGAHGGAGKGEAQFGVKRE